MQGYCSFHLETLVISREKPHMHDIDAKSVICSVLMMEKRRKNDETETRSFAEVKWVKLQQHQPYTRQGGTIHAHLSGEKRLSCEPPEYVDTEQDAIRSEC